MIINEWQKWFGDYSYFNVTVPEGYTLVETKEHQAERLQRQIENRKTMLSYHEKKAQELVSLLEAEEKELLELTK